MPTAQTRKTSLTNAADAAGIASSASSLLSTAGVAVQHKLPGLKDVHHYFKGTQNEETSRLVS